MSIHTTLIERKSGLFSAVVIVIVGILIEPIILPNLFHGSHTIHIVIHTGGLIAAVFLTMISSIAYLNLRTNRLFFTLIAFSVLVAAQTVSLVDITWPFTFYVGNISFGEVEHMLIMSMIGAFIMAVFRND